MDRGSTPRTSTIAAARHHLQHSADPCGVFAYVPAAALPLAKFRFAPPLAEYSFRLASALAPSRELCSRGGFAAKPGAHLAPSLRLECLSLLLRSRSVRPALHLFEVFLDTMSAFPPCDLLPLRPRRSSSISIPVCDKAQNILRQPMSTFTNCAHAYRTIRGYPATKGNR